MEIKQLKLNGENIYPKVAIDSIVGEDGSSKVDTVVTENSDNLIISGAVYEAIQSGIGHSVAWENITGKPEFANVATSGDYNDLINKPSFKTVNNESITGIGNIAVQPVLVSGTNIKTINGNSLLGSGNIDIQSGGSGSVNSVSYSNNAGDFAPDANGKVTLTIDQALSGDSGKPVTNAAISTKFNSVDAAISNVNSTVTSMTTTLVNHSNAITAIERVLWKDDENQIDKVNGRIDSLSSVVDSALTDIDDCVETIEISNNKLKYTTSGGVTPVDVATIDTVATKNSKNLVTSGAVLNSVGNSFDSKSKYFKGFGLSSVESVFDIHGQLIDPSVNTRVGYIELTIEWFNAKCDAGETDRLVKKSYVVGKEPVIIENSQWDPSGIITDINSYPGNGTDFSLYSQPSFTYSSSGGRIDVQIHLGLQSSKYQVHSITITKAYDPYNVELQLAEAFQSTAQYLYHYTDDPQPGIYVIEGDVILRTNNNWYKIGDAEESPMKPNT